MAKPDPARLDPAAYPYRVEITTRFGDMDALRHLNNVALASLYEDARVRFSTTEVDLTALREKGFRLVVGEVCIRYLAEGAYPAPASVGVGVARVGASSFTLAQALFQGGRCIGTCETVLVYIKADEGRSRPLPPALREALVAKLVRGGEVEGARGESPTAAAAAGGPA